MLASAKSVAFEDAAAIHVKLEKLKPVLNQFPEIVRRLDRLSALMIQPCHLPNSVTFFRVASGAITGSGDVAANSNCRQLHEIAVDGIAGAGRYLEAFPPAKARPALETMEHLALLKRWYYRGRRIGEIFLPDDQDVFPMRRIVRGIGRVLRGKGTQRLILPNRFIKVMIRIRAHHQAGRGVSDSQSHRHEPSSLAPLG